MVALEAVPLLVKAVCISHQVAAGGTAGKDTNSTMNPSTPVRRTASGSSTVSVRSGKSVGNATDLTGGQGCAGLLLYSMAALDRISAHHAVAQQILAR